MDIAISKAIKIYRYSLILFTIGYWIYVIIDDYNFIVEYWSSSWLMYLGIWLLYYIAYLVAFSIYFWIATAVIIFIYHKVVKPRRNRTS